MTNSTQGACGQLFLNQTQEDMTVTKVKSPRLEWLSVDLLSSTYEGTVCIVVLVTGREYRRQQSNNQKPGTMHKKCNIRRIKCTEGPGDPSCPEKAASAKNQYRDRTSCLKVYPVTKPSKSYWPRETNRTPAAAFASCSVSAKRLCLDAVRSASLQECLMRWPLHMTSP